MTFPSQDLVAQLIELPNQTPNATRSGEATHPRRMATHSSHQAQRCLRSSQPRASGLVPLDIPTPPVVSKHPSPSNEDPVRASLALAAAPQRRNATRLFQTRYASLHPLTTPSRGRDEQILVPGVVGRLHLLRVR